MNTWQGLRMAALQQHEADLARARAVLLSEVPGRHRVVRALRPRALRRRAGSLLVSAGVRLLDPADLIAEPPARRVA